MAVTLRSSAADANNPAKDVSFRRRQNSRLAHFVLAMFPRLVYTSIVPSTEGRPREASFGWGGMRHLRARYAIASRGGSRSKTGWAHYQDALRSETRRRQIAGMPPWRAERRGAHRRRCALPAGNQSGNARVTGSAFSARHPPHLRGAKRAQDGRTPAPKQSNRGRNSFA